MRIRAKVRSALTCFSLDHDLLLTYRDIEYVDDTTIIPRSTSIVARRHPAVRPGKGGAARYVSGKMPVGARGLARPDFTVPNQDASAVGAPSELDNSRSEDEKIKALFNLQESQWREQQQEMSS